MIFVLWAITNGSPSFLKRKPKPILQCADITPELISSFMVKERYFFKQPTSSMALLDLSTGAKSGVSTKGNITKHDKPGEVTKQ